MVSSTKPATSGQSGSRVKRVMTRLKSFITNRIIISLLVIATLGWAFVLHFQPVSRWFYVSGLRAYNSGDYPRAVSLLDDARRLEPHNSAVLVLLGWSLVKTGKPARAEKMFLDASARDPHDLDRQLGLVYAEIGLKRLQPAEQLLNEIREERPDWIETFIAESFLRRDAGLRQVAAAELQRALALDPNNRFIAKLLDEISSPTAPLRTIAPPERFGSLVSPAAPPAQRSVAQPASPAEQHLAAARALTSRDEFPAAIAQYQTYLESRPNAVPILYELGDLLLRINHAPEAAPVFRRLLSIDPQNAGGALGLAEALAALGRYREARLRYRQVLNASPGNYEARQGLANVLLWTRRYSAARRMFLELAEEEPEDPVNHAALAAIAARGSARYWASLRPAPGAPPIRFIAYDNAFLAGHSADHATLIELAHNQVMLGDLAAAIATYRRIRDLYPADQDSQLHLARALAWTGHFGRALHIYQTLLQTSPRDVGVLQKAAQVDLRDDRLPASLELDRRLLRLQPGDTGLMLRIADLESRLDRYPDARETLATAATLHPENRAVQLGLAALDERQGDWKGAQRRYQEILAGNPNDAAALYADARLAYWQGDLTGALDEAQRLIRLQPADADALLLAARIENARGRIPQARALVAHAGKAAPHSAEVERLQRALRSESVVTVHTSSTYAREVGPLTSYFSPQGRLIKTIPNEDLSAYSNAMTVGFSWLPRSQSAFSIASMPSNSPYGAIQGAVGPGEFEYRQSTRVASFLTVRGGIGLERFGPGQSVVVPSQNFQISTPETAIPVTRLTPVGYAGFTVKPTHQLSLNFALSRDGMPDTPLSVKFGVVRTRKLIGLRDELDRRDHVHLTWYHDSYHSALWYRINPAGGPPTLEANGLDQATGGTLDYDHTLIQSEQFSVGAGYSGVLLGYTGPGRDVYMGFYNPDFYQRHFATTRAQGHVWGPLSYQFEAGYGRQQLAHHQPFIPAYQLNPSLSLRVNPRLSVTLGYVHYNFSQALGPLTGNAVQISTDSKFW